MKEYIIKQKDLTAMQKNLIAIGMIEATSVTRCKDCIHYRGHRNYCENDMFAKEDGFCSWAERKEA